MFREVEIAIKKMYLIVNRIRKQFTLVVFHEFVFLEFFLRMENPFTATLLGYTVLQAVADYPFSPFVLST